MCNLIFNLWASEPGSAQEVPSLLWWHCALCSTFIGMDGKVGVGYDFFGCALWFFFFFFEGTPGYMLIHDVMSQGKMVNPLNVTGDFWCRCLG